MAIRAELIEQDRVEVDLDRDRALVLRYQRGDEAAFDELYRRYYPRLNLYCQRRVGDRHVAEELAQEAFVRALRAMPRFAGERRFYPWMTVIAQRLCIDHHRRTSRVEPAADIDPGVVDSDHDALFAAVDAGHVAEAMQRVAPRHREVLELRERQGWSYLQIASHLNVPVTTVEALLHRARKALRREYLAVSSGTRLAGVPVLGAGLAAIARWRARLANGGRLSQHAMQLAPAAIAGVAAVGFMLVPGSAPQPQHVGTATPAAVAAAPAAETAPTEPAAAVVVAPPATAAVTAQPASTASAPPDAPAPSADLGVAQVYSGPDATDYWTKQVEQSPVHVDLGALAQVGLDPGALLDRLLGGGK